MERYYVLVASTFSGIYLDADNFKEAKSANSIFTECSFDDFNKAETFLRSNYAGEINKFYAVKNGRIKGIVISWNDCSNLVSGFAGAKYKGFITISDAVDYYCAKTINGPSSKVSCANEFPEHYAFVDGSYNSHKKKYGYGVVLVTNGKTYQFSGSNNNPQLLPMRNVSGEIEGSMRAITEAIKLNLPEITIFYDYEGIKKWATGEWQRNKKGTIDYHAFICESKERIKINFVKVKAHSGVELNEKVDKIAKKAVGLA